MDNALNFVLYKTLTFQVTELGVLGEIVVMENKQEHALIHHQLMVLIVGENLIRSVTKMNAQVRLMLSTSIIFMPHHMKPNYIFREENLKFQITLFQERYH